MYDIASVGNQIRNRRKRMKITQGELAEKLKVSFQAVSSWEKGNTIPDVENLCKLAAIFKVPVDTLLSGDSKQVMLAVDGGGTKSEFVLFTPKGNVLKRFKLAATNAVIRGVDAVTETLSQGVDMCVSEHINLSTVYIGTGGPELEEIQSRLRARYPKMSVVVESDSLNALYCDIGTAAVICGTGSVLIRKDGDQIIASGGWGHMVKDPGSAMDIARRALQFCADHEDNVRQSPVLYEKMCKQVGNEKLAYPIFPRDVTYIASLARAVFAALEEGDADAKQILEEQMFELSRQINAVFRSETKVNLCGGMFEHHGDILVPILQKFVKKCITFVVPTLPPVYGACLRCCDLSQVAVTAEFRENFEADYRANCL